MSQFFERQASSIQEQGRWCLVQIFFGANLHLCGSCFVGVVSFVVLLLEAPPN